MNPRLKIIKLLVMDVDGTLTDGAMYYSAKGEELKRFSTRDGMGITLLHQYGIKTAILTSEASQIAIARAEKLKINEIIIGHRNKKAALIDLKEKNNIELENIAYIGDDINDIEAMEIAGFSACPADASEIIKTKAGYICKSAGGNGAVREFCEMILTAKELPLTLSENW